MWSTAHFALRNRVVSAALLQHFALRTTITPPIRHYHHNQTLTYLYGMQTAYFRQKADDPQVHINFRYQNASLQIDRVFNLSRNCSETVAACMQRIQANVQKELTKRKRPPKANKKGQSDRDIGAELAADAATATVSESNVSGVALVAVGGVDDALPASFGEQTMLEMLTSRTAGTLADLQLVIFGNRFEVAYNLPWVHAITLPSSILAGYFVYPAKLELDGCDNLEAEFQWFVASDADGATSWTPVGESFQWQVTPECVGRTLKVVCTPRRGDLRGPAVEAVSKHPVAQPPAGECLYVQRHRHTERRLDGAAFRVVSYNLLADLYADSDYSRAELFPYIPAAALQIDYRKQLFVRELHGYRADIICLQEVDAKIFDYDLVPVLGYGQLEGRFQRKGATAEGLATFYDRRRFDLVSSHGANIADVLPELECMKDLWQAISTNEALAERIRARSTAVQVQVLRSRDQPSKVLLVANTHLYFHPDADHIRLLQFATAVRYVQHVRDGLLSDERQQRAEDVSIVFCGDFNSVPECGIYRLMTTKRVPRDFVDFQSNPAQAIANIDLEQPFSMRSAYESIRYTNFTVGFTECIDYIFYQTDDLRCLQTVPPPSDEQLRAHTAIPSVLHPSDHIALVADFEWQRRPVAASN